MNNKKYRRDLRKNMTQQEIILWSRIRERELDHKFRRQHSISRYIVDFFCSEKGLVVEIDGDQHAFQVGYDRDRTRHIESLGYKVVRVSNREINVCLEDVLQTIENSLRDT